MTSSGPPAPPPPASRGPLLLRPCCRPLQAGLRQRQGRALAPRRPAHPSCIPSRHSASLRKMRTLGVGALDDEYYGEIRDATSPMFQRFVRLFREAGVGKKIINGSSASIIVSLPRANISDRRKIWVKEIPIDERISPLEFRPIEEGGYDINVGNTHTRWQREAAKFRHAIS